MSRDKDRTTTATRGSNTVGVERVFVMDFVDKEGTEFSVTLDLDEALCLREALDEALSSSNPA